jgi:hypothetical protein
MREMLSDAQILSVPYAFKISVSVDLKGPFSNLESLPISVSLSCAFLDSVYKHTIPGYFNL